MEEKKSVHIRRCHVCNGISERTDAQVDRCDQCGKSLAPYYFFDEKSVRVYSVDEYRPDPLAEMAHEQGPVPDNGTRVPIRGFSAIW